MNRVVLVGRLARDPMELRRSVNNVATISFTIAVDNRSKDENKKADFISCVAFNKSAEIVDQYFKKGMLVAVEGRLQSRSYEKDGRTVYVTEVVCDSLQMLESKGAREEREFNSSSSQTTQEQDFEEERSPAYDIVDDDLLS